MDSRRKRLAGAAGFMIACFCVIYGVFRGEAGIVFHKAVNICFECIGLG
ncbi:MAG: thioredoxin [Eubacterium sp.]|nr:thioredoxin [Eubacterium sp.]